VVDIDHSYSREEIFALARTLPYRPTYIEKSLGVGWRFVFLLEDKVPWPEKSALSTVAFEGLQKLLGLNLVFGVDYGSWSRSTQLYANGGVWEMLEKSEPIPLAQIETTIFNAVVTASRKSRSVEVQLPRIAKMIVKKWPGWEWPEDSVEGSQGPTWWVEGSTSPRSAIVHADGMYTFADHADKEWWTWEDLLGRGAIEKDREEQIARAVADYHTDGRMFFKPRHDGGHEELKPDALRRRLIGRNGLSPHSSKKRPQSEVDQVILQIEETRRVDFVAPFVYRPPGIIVYNSYRYLNTLDLRPMQPAMESTCWGQEGRFPWISEWLDRIFIHPDQLAHWTYWLHWYYRNAVDRTPEQGQSVIMAGGAGIGKTFLNVGILSVLMGGHEDAVRFLMREDSFGGHLFRRGLWTIDAQTMAASNITLRKFTGAFKRTVANCEHEYHLKFGTPCQVSWDGRVNATCNLDMWSQMLLPSLEESLRDKVNFYRLIDNQLDSPDHLRLPINFFPRKRKLLAIRDEELPWFARYIYDLEIPREWEGDSRYGIRSFQDAEMSENAFLNSGASSAYEVIAQFMEYYQKLEESSVFEGTAVNLLSSIHEIPALSTVARGMNIDSLTRRLAQMSDVNHEVVSHYTDEFGMRRWVIDWSKRKKRSQL
jgi:hypothetical protein